MDDTKSLIKYNSDEDDFNIPDNESLNNTITMEEGILISKDQLKIDIKEIYNVNTNDTKH